MRDVPFNFTREPPPPSTLIGTVPRRRFFKSLSVADVWIRIEHAVSFDILLSDKGYDDQKIRRLARQYEVQPLIKHREFTSIHKAWNARLDADLYGQRSQSETVDSTLKRKYGAFVRSRHWWKQFRELTIACLVRNLNRSL